MRSSPSSLCCAQWSRHYLPRKSSQDMHNASAELDASARNRMHDESCCPSYAYGHAGKTCGGAMEAPAERRWLQSDHMLTGATEDDGEVGGQHSSLKGQNEARAAPVYQSVMSWPVQRCNRTAQARRLQQSQRCAADSSPLDAYIISAGRTRHTQSSKLNSATNSPSRCALSSLSVSLVSST